MGFSIGHALGNYRIAGRLGAGGMGEVYLAEHPLLGKKVALKVIHRDLAANREVIARFFNEARAVSRIGSDHIVEVHDFGQTPDGHHFFVMEYLGGRTVADELARHGKIDPARTLHIGAQIAAALGAAHDHQVIHRDLKPDNVMLVDKLGDPDFVKVLDFGLAKVLASDAPQLTGAGVVLGTPQYMSPEAAESRADIDHRSDVYALGILLFQMACGRVPFDAPSMGEVLVKQVCHPPPAPRALEPDVPPALEQIILRCLTKSPAARFQDMAELRAALLAPDAYLASSPPVVPAALVPASRPPGLAAPGAARNETMVIPTPPGIARRGRRWLGVAALFAAAAVSGGGAALLAQGGGGAAAAPVEADAAPATVSIEVVTDPPGATVVDEEGVALGVTPLAVGVPADRRQRIWSLRHPESRRAEASFVATAPVALRIDLEPSRPPPDAAPPPAPAPARKRPRRPARPPPNDGLMAPDL